MPEAVSRRELVFLLGLPRSGAAELAEALSKLGLDFGPRQEGDEEAVERPDLNRFHLACFSEFQLNPLSVCSLPPAWRSHPRAPALLRDLRTQLSSILAAQGPAPVGIKSTTAALLLPIYQAVFEELGIRPHIVVCVRNPLSLTQEPVRYPFARTIRPSPPLGDRAIGLWLHQTLSALTAADRDRLTVVTDEMLQRPADVPKAIAEKHPNWSPANIEAISWQPPETRMELKGELKGELPDLVTRTLELCNRLAQGDDARDELTAIVQEFHTWREMLAPPGNPGTQVGFAWTERGKVEVSQVPFLPSGDWQALSVPIPAPAVTEVFGLLYGQPCRVWLRRFVWKYPSGQTEVRAAAGPGSRLVRTEAGLCLEGAYEPKQLRLVTPAAPGPYELEMEFLLEAGSQISIGTARRLAERLNQCLEAQHHAQPDPQGRRR